MKTTKLLLASSVLASVAYASPNLSEMHPDNFDAQVFSLGIPITLDLSSSKDITKDKDKTIGIKLTNKATLLNSYGNRELYWRGGGAYNYNFTNDSGGVNAHIGLGNTFTITDHTFFNIDGELFYDGTVGSSKKKDKKKDIDSYGIEFTGTYGFRIYDGLDTGIKGSLGYGKAKYNGLKGNVKTGYVGVPLKFNMGESVYVNLEFGYKQSSYSMESVKDTKQGVVGLSVSWKYSMWTTHT